VKRIAAALKRNEIVFILADNLKRGKIQTRFFGQTVRSSRGPVSLAFRSGAPVLPMYLIRDYDGRSRLVIEPEIPLTRNGRLPEDIEENTRRITHYLETLIRRYPDQWNWLTVRMNSGPADPYHNGKLQGEELPNLQENPQGSCHQDYADTPDPLDHKESAQRR
jgi:KDO2-lipid IV(A) lauroyltransferase